MQSSASGLLDGVAACSRSRWPSPAWWSKPLEERSRLMLSRMQAARAPAANAGRESGRGVRVPEARRSPPTGWPSCTASARATGVELQSASYRTPDAGGRIERYEIVLPVTGSYAQMRDFLKRAQRRDPGAVGRPDDAQARAAQATARCRPSCASPCTWCSHETRLLMLKKRAVVRRRARARSPAWSSAARRRRRARAVERARRRSPADDIDLAQARAAARPSAPATDPFARRSFARREAAAAPPRRRSPRRRRCRSATSAS